MNFSKFSYRPSDEGARCAIKHVYVVSHTSQASEVNKKFTIWLSYSLLFCFERCFHLRSLSFNFSLHVWGFYIICNLWILLRKIVTSCRLKMLSLCTSLLLKVTVVTSTQESVL